MKTKSVSLLILDFLGALYGLGLLLIGFLFLIPSMSYFAVAIRLGELNWSEEVDPWMPWVILFVGLMSLILGIFLPRLVIKITEDIHKLKSGV